MDNHAEIPEWLHKARAEIGPGGRVESTDDWPLLPSIGDLRLAEPVDAGACDCRIVCVVGVTPMSGVAEVAMVSNEIDLASELDIVIPRNQLDLPFDVMIQTDVRNRLWLIQLDGLVSRLAPPFINVLRSAVSKGPRSIPRELRGSPRMALGDVGNLFKQAEKDALESLGVANEDTRPSGSSSTPIVIDPAVLTSGGEVNEGTRFERLLRVAQEVARSSRVLVPIHTLERQIGSAGFDLEDWIAQYGPDAWYALSPLLERVLGASTPESAIQLEFRPGRSHESVHSDGELEAAISGLIDRGHRAIRVLSVPDAWESGPEERWTLASAERPDGRSLQIVRENLEAYS